MRIKNSLKNFNATQIEEIGERVFKRRNDASISLSRKELAELTELSVDTIKRIELGIRKEVYLEQLNKISKPLKTSLSYLLLETDEVESGFGNRPDFDLSTIVQVDRFMEQNPVFYHSISYIIMQMSSGLRTSIINLLNSYVEMHKFFSYDIDPVISPLELDISAFTTRKSETLDKIKAGEEYEYLYEQFNTLSARADMLIYEVAYLENKCFDNNIPLDD